MMSLSDFGIRTTVVPHLSLFPEEFVKHWHYFFFKYAIEFIGEVIWAWAFFVRRFLIRDSIY